MRRASIVAAACGAVVLVLAARRAPPFREISDGAILEIYTLEALRGTLLVGPYSRFGWHHPGPLYFYLQAPWYWLSGLHTAGMQAGALALNLASVALIGWTLARCASTPIAVAVSAFTAWYAVRTGDMLVSVWNPHVIVLPMLAYLVVAAALAATGRRVLLLWLVFVGTFLVQTHLAMTPIVVVAGAVAIAAGRRSLSGMWLLALTLGLLLWLPPSVEQLRHRPGNLVAIVRFFAERAAGQNLAVAADAWSWALTSAFRGDFAVAAGHDILPSRSIALWLAILEVAALGGAVTLTKRRDPFTAWLAALGGVATLAALGATTRIRDQIVDHEIFWMSALGVLNVAVIAGSVALASLSHARVRPSRFTAATCVLAFLVVAMAGAAGMRHMLGRSRTVDDHSVDVLTESIERYLSTANVRRPLFHIEPPIWPIAAGALLQIDKRHVRFAVGDRWTTMFGESFAPDGSEDAELTMTGSRLAPVLTPAR